MTMPAAFGDQGFDVFGAGDVEWGELGLALGVALGIQLRE